MALATNQPEPSYELSDLQGIDPGSRMKVTIIDHELVREDFRGKVIDCEFRSLDLNPEYEGDASLRERMEDSRYWMLVAHPSPGADDPFQQEIEGAHPRTLIFSFHVWLIEDIEFV